MLPIIEKYKIEISAIKIDLIHFEIIIIYDDTVNELNRIQVITRLRKLLGFDIQIDFGSFDQFDVRIRQMVGVERKAQKFGSWY